MENNIICVVDGKEKPEHSFRSVSRNAKATIYIGAGKDRPAIRAAFTKDENPKDWIREQGLLEKFEATNEQISRWRTDRTPLESRMIQAKEALAQAPRKFWSAFELSQQETQAKFWEAEGSSAVTGTNPLIGPVSFAALWEHCGYGGQNLLVPPGPWPDFRWLWPWSGNWNDRVSSLRLIGVAITLWEHINFEGGWSFFIGYPGIGFDCLVADGFNDRASSAICV